MNSSPRGVWATVVWLTAASAAWAQTGPRSDQSDKPSPPPPAAVAQAPPATSSASPAAPADRAGTPTEAELGLPVYPTSEFLTSYDAGRGQRFYLFGSTSSFAELVTYYKAMLREKGNPVFDQPPTHTFEVGKFREDTMAFPPGVTVKDYTWGGSGGYPNPKRGAMPERFSTVIQIVPAPAVTAPAPRR